jgi:hypothetical protein
MKLCLGAAVLAAVAAISVTGCSNGSLNGSESVPASASNVGSGGGSNEPGGNPGLGGSASSASADAAALPPETKVESNYQSPVATGNVVWIANPTSGRVAYIDSKTFAVKTEPAGDGPTFLAAIPDPDPTHQPPHDLAVVLNVVSHDATLFALTPPVTGTDIDGQLTKTIEPSTPYANAWAISKSGRWAIAWTNTNLVASPDPIQGYDRIEVLDVTGARPPTALSVGFAPVQMVFSGDETHAYAVTADGITVIDLTTGSVPLVTQSYPLGAPSPAGAPDASQDAGTTDAATQDAGAQDGAQDAGPLDGAQDGAQDAGPLDGAQDDGAQDDAVQDGSDGGDPAVEPGAAPAMVGSGTPDVSFSPDATFALVRQDGVQSITVISLADGKATLVSLPDFPTDLTMSPTGTFAVAVLRDTSTVAILPIPGIASDPASFTTTAIPGETIGRAIVTSQGQTALLFTTAAAVDRLTVLTFAPAPSYRTITLHAPVLAVFPTDDARHAIVLHSLPPGSIDQGAFSVVPIATDLPAAIEPLSAPPTAVALTNDRALVTISNEATAQYAVYVAAMPSLVSTEVALASPPLAVGIVPGAPVGSVDAGAASPATGYVAQDYSEGRITFIDLSADGDGGARTITGFELSAGIVEGTEQ